MIIIIYRYLIYIKIVIKIYDDTKNNDNDNDKKKTFIIIYYTNSRQI